MRPLNGADSADGWNPRRFRVLLEDEEGGRRNVIIRSAIGRMDAMNQARDQFPDDYALTAEEASLDYADAEMQRAKEAS